MFCETEACRLEYLIIFVPSWPPSYWVTDLCAVVAWILMVGRHQLKKRVLFTKWMTWDLSAWHQNLRRKLTFSPLAVCASLLSTLFLDAQYLVALVWITPCWRLNVVENPRISFCIWNGLLNASWEKGPCIKQRVALEELSWGPCEHHHFQEEMLSISKKLFIEHEELQRRPLLWGRTQLHDV